MPTYEDLAAPRNSGRFAGLIKDLKPGEVREIAYEDEKDEQRKRNGIRSIGRTRGLPLVTRKQDETLYVVYLNPDDYEVNGFDSEGHLIPRAKKDDKTPFAKGDKK